MAHISIIDIYTDGITPRTAQNIYFQFTTLE